MAVNHNTPVALFSLEMSNVQLVNRLIVNVCEIPGEKIKSGRLENYEWEQLDFKIKELYDAPIYVDDTPSLSVFELRTKARRLVREHGIKIWLPAAFAILPEPFTEQNGMVNSTMKIVRGKIEKAYASRIDHLYTPEGKNPVNEENKKALNC